MNALRAIPGSLLVAVLVFGVLPAHAQDLGKLLSGGQSVQPNVLANQRGGTEQSIVASQSADVNGVSFGNTGTNTFGSFGNAQGMITAVQNTGNNVAIQTEVVLNVNMH
jgi:hypothetical protein